MLATLLLILPFAAASALSPVMLTEQTVLLAKKRKSARRYALGVFLTAFVFVALVTLFGGAISLPSEPTLSSSLDIVLGVLLISIAAGLYLIRRRTARRPTSKGEEKKEPRIGKKGSFAFGVFSMATNFTSLALLLPAAKIIADSGFDYPERLPLEILVAAFAATPAWLPLALTRVLPGPARHALNWTDRTIEQRGAELVAAALLILGIFLVLRGVVGL